MCETELEYKYQSLAQGQSALESSLHINLAEHINSEIGLETISTVDTAKDWMHNSFLFQRIQQNPQRYAIGKQVEQTWEERLSDIVNESIANLKAAELVSHDEKSGELCSTEYGIVMSKVS